MYCSSCGAAVARGLSYCKHCGAKLGGAGGEGGDKPAELFPDSLIWAIVSVFVVGMGTTIGLMAMLKRLLDLNQTVIIAFGLLGFALMIAVECVFIWMLLSRRKGAGAAGEGAGAKENTTRELDAARVRALAEPVPSVTEETTRAFEPIYVERKAE